jgi:hypothetical protein
MGAGFGVPEVVFEPALIHGPNVPSYMFDETGFVLALDRQLQARWVSADVHVGYPEPTSVTPVRFWSARTAPVHSCFGVR